MKKKILPTVSVVIATFNAEKTLPRVLDSIRVQDYPPGLVDITIVDGGSKDRTLEIAKKYTQSIISVDPAKQNAEYNKCIGIHQAKGELLFLIDHDNVLPTALVLRHMVQPLLDYPAVVGVETLRYHYDLNASLLDRYFALFGAGDPLAWYLGKADRLSFLYDRYNLAGRTRDMGAYYLVTFSPDHIPTLGANGFIVRRALLMKHAKVDPQHFYHIDVNVDLIRKGYNTYAFTKDAILHLSGYKNLWSFLSRRKLFLEQFHLSSAGMTARAERRYSVFEPKDKWKLFWFVCISLTIIIPLADSIRGFRKIHDPAWFLHPFLCFVLVVLYGWIIIKHQFRLLATSLMEKV